MLLGHSGSCVHQVATALLSRWPKDSTIHQVIVDCSEFDGQNGQSADNVARSICARVYNAAKESNASRASRPQLILIMTISGNFSVDLPLFVERCIPPSCNLKCVVSVVSGYLANLCSSVEINPYTSLEAAYFSNNRYAELFSCL